MDDEDLEPCVLSYDEFRSREVLNAWYERKRAHDQQLMGQDQQLIGDAAGWPSGGTAGRSGAPSV